MRFTTVVIHLAISGLTAGAAFAAATTGELTARQLPTCGDPVLVCTGDADCAACPSVPGVTFTCQDPTGLGLTMVTSSSR